MREILPLRNVIAPDSELTQTFATLRAHIIYLEESILVRQDRMRHNYTWFGKTVAEFICNELVITSEMACFFGAQGEN